MSRDDHYRSVLRKEIALNISLGILIGLPAYLMAGAGLLLTAAVMSLLFVGSILNSLAVLANDGYMPVSVKDDFTRRLVANSLRHITATPETRFRVLTDQIYLSSWVNLFLGKLHIKAVFSLGDALSVLSVPLIIATILV